MLGALAGGCARGPWSGTMPPADLAESACSKAGGQPTLQGFCQFDQLLISADEAGRLQGQIVLGCSARGHLANRPNYPAMGLATTNRVRPLDGAERPDRRLETSGHSSHKNASEICTQVRFPRVSAVTAARAALQTADGLGSPYRVPNRGSMSLWLGTSPAHDATQSEL